MKKLLLISFVLLVGCITAFAVPAKPGVKRTVTLADGSKVELTLRGDEHYKFYTGSDGFAYREKKKGFERFSLAEARNQWRTSITRANTARRGKTRALGVPATYTGKKKGLVILMQFKDLSFVTENVQNTFNDFFNKENYTDNGMTGSVKDYFKAQSYGQFELDFDVVGPFTARDSMAYYGAHYTDEDGDDRNDSHPAELAYEACLQADSLVNFADYDWDGDGVVDQVFVIFAGYAEAQGAAPETMWPHAWVLAGEGYNNVVLDGVKVNTYACSSELRLAEGSDLDGIGTACHEFSHCLGLPDTYDTSGQGYFGMGNWDLMGSGNYNDNAKTPAGYTSYERWFAGWLTPIELKGDKTQISNMKALVDSPEAYILYNEGNKNEYYLLENRQKKGFDAGLNGHGLLVLHVDYDKDAWTNNKVNTDSLHQRLTIIAADNEYGLLAASLVGDPFPGTSGNTTLTNYTTPAATLYNVNSDGEKLMNKSIEDITESEEGLISFVAMRPQIVPPSPDNGEAVGDENSFKISWPAVEGAIGYQVELTDKGIVPSNVADALEHEFDFNGFVTDSVGQAITGKLDAYGLDGWTGKYIYTSPNKMLIGNGTDKNHLNTAEWNMPKSTEITLVIGADKVDKNADAYGVVFFVYRDKTDEDIEYEYKTFDITADSKIVLHFTGIKDLYYFQIQAKPQMYLNYLAVYNGTWSEADLGIAGANARGNTRAISTTTVYDTDTNSYTFTGLNKESNYHYRVRAVGEDNVYSVWSAEKVFSFSTTGISNILQDNTAKSRAIYNLQGRNMGTNPSALPKGIYIINGKKVVK